ncbi:MAG: peptidylprolyl isomerase [Pseudomonadota bacterium]
MISILKKSAIPVALCLSGIVLSGCEREPSTLTSVRSVDAATAALVNGEPIYISDVELEATAQGKIEPGTPFDPNNPDFKQVLDELIDQRLLAQEAQRRGLDQSTDARRRLEAAQERILGNILVENLVANEVTDTAIDAMYAEQVRLQQLDDEVRLRHILLETEDAANGIYRQLERGADFTELAFENSEDVRTRLDGGSFGWVAPNEMISPFPEQIGDTETGSIGGPFESEQGWHVIKVEERRTRPPKTKEEMRPEIITFLTFTEISEILRELRAEADIQKRPQNQTTQETSSGGLEDAGEPNDEGDEDTGDTETE